MIFQRLNQVSLACNTSSFPLYYSSGSSKIILIARSFPVYSKDPSLMIQHHMTYSSSTCFSSLKSSFPSQDLSSKSTGHISFLLFLRMSSGSSSTSREALTKQRAHLHYIDLSATAICLVLMHKSRERKILRVEVK